MNEDIKILENKIKRSRDLFNDIGSHTYLDEPIMQMIENLISRNKELEQENKILKNKQTKIIADSFHEKMAKKFDDDFILKSKIKEKIEELNDLNSKFSQRVIKSKEFYLTELVQNILQELLDS